MKAPSPCRILDMSPVAIAEPRGALDMCIHSLSSWQGLVGPIDLPLVSPVSVLLSTQSVPRDARSDHRVRWLRSRRNQHYSVNISSFESTQAVRLRGEHSRGHLLVNETIKRLINR